MNPLKYAPSEYAKAIAGAVLAGLTSLATAMATGNVSADEWLGVAIAAVATFAGVFGVPNRPAPVRHHRGAEAGHFDPWGLLGVILLACVIVWLATKVLH